jgi:hypothetical protein
MSLWHYWNPWKKKMDSTGGKTWMMIDEELTQVFGRLSNTLHISNCVMFRPGLAFDG